MAQICMQSLGEDTCWRLTMLCVAQLFREALLSEGFQEIHTPKLIAGASEGGAAVFKLDYVGQPGCLAQSPQFYKQMAICSDMSRVFEIGPVFRQAPKAVPCVHILACYICACCFPLADKDIPPHYAAERP